MTDQNKKETANPNNQLAAAFGKKRELPDEMPDVGDEVMLLWQDTQLQGAILPLVLKVLGTDVESGKVWGYAWMDPTTRFKTEDGEMIKPPPLMSVENAWYSSVGKANSWFYHEDYEEWQHVSMLKVAKIMQQSTDKVQKADGIALEAALMAKKAERDAEYELELGVDEDEDEDDDDGDYLLNLVMSNPESRAAYEAHKANTNREDKEGE